MFIRSPDHKTYTPHIIDTHLFIDTIIYVGFGLYFDFIYAWKSGKNPSANNDISNTENPIHSNFLSSPCFTYGSKNLNNKIPKDTIIPIIIFWYGNFNFLSVTREQNIPTRITDSKLQDLTVATIG